MCQTCGCEPCKTCGMAIKNGYASVATIHPKNAPARRNRKVPSRKGPKRHRNESFETPPLHDASKTSGGGMV
jgi:hypothetical protein